MWNRQREAEAAREKLALAGEGAVGTLEAPNRNPPALDDDIPLADILPLDVPAADAAE
jgi:hypothetical protein